MAKVPGKKDAPQEPQIHRIALPVSDESLVIDLPDGQKLVVGKMATGSVIEVATWRGTGRPDSRTTRLMLGMSNAMATEQANTEAAQSSSDAVGAQGVGSFVAKLQGLVGGIKLPKFAAKNEPAGESADSDSLQSISLPTESDRSEKIEKAPKSEKSDRRSLWSPPTPADSTSGEADKWLEEIMARAAARESKSSTAVAAKSSEKSSAKVSAKKAPAKKTTAKKTAGSKSTSRTTQGRTR